jgi:hypothetical protein
VRVIRLGVGWAVVRFGLKTRRLGLDWTQSGKRSQSGGKLELCVAVSFISAQLR